MDPTQPPPVAPDAPGLNLGDLPRQPPPPAFEIKPLMADVSEWVRDAQRRDEAGLRRRYLHAAMGMRDLALRVIEALETPDRDLHEVRVPHTGEYAFVVMEFMAAMGVLQDLPTLRQSETWNQRPPIQIAPVPPPSPPQPARTKRRRK